MKTKNNVQKAAIKSIALATGLMLTGLTLNAQMSSFFENTGNSPMAMVTEKTMKSGFVTSVNTKTLATTNTFAIYLVNETEEPLHLEEWMTNESNFEASSMGLITDSEEELQIESWMLDENKFEVTEKTKVAQKETKKVIVGANYTFVEETDNGKLQVESWMLNTKAWKIR
ncbi:MAG TPA: hypothetical protein VK872_04745 [Draconibacterium sp.]|jgi:hypothetical protein|nr:hypothetical protein [Draconibacterium sp.]